MGYIILRSSLSTASEIDEKTGRPICLNEHCPVEDRESSMEDLSKDGKIREVQFEGSAYMEGLTAASLSEAR
jgi:hypothetical protein